MRVVFGFQGNVSEKIALKLSGRVFIIPSSKDSVYKLVDDLIALQPKHILGLGSYSGRDRNFIRIERFCSNKFRNRLIGKNPERLQIDPFVNRGKGFKLSDGGMGNSYCNLISYLIQSQVNQGVLRSKFSFLHIPKGMNTIWVSEILNHLLNLDKSE